ncbi:MAG: hypothetical protein ACK5MY_02715 [Jhaorihella sp.]
MTTIQIITIAIASAGVGAAGAAAIGTGAYLPPCVTEDSSNCVWNAAERGNATGASFIEYDGALYFREGATE